MTHWKRSETATAGKALELLRRKGSKKAAVVGRAVVEIIDVKSGKITATYSADAGPGSPVVIQGIDSVVLL